jgi:hypothetical protein
MPFVNPLWGANVMTAASSDMEGALVWSAGTQASAVALSNGTTDPANSGTHSLKITLGATTTGAMCVNGTTEIPVTPLLYYVSAWFQTPDTGVSVNLNVEWYTSAQVFINSVLTPTIALTQNVWTRYPASAVTVGATGAFMRINPQITAGQVSTHLMWLDSLRVSQFFGNNESGYQPPLAVSGAYR